MEEVFLRPCPFCGGKAELIVRGPQARTKVQCWGCGASSFPVIPPNKDLTIKLWNTRTEAPEAYLVTDVIENCTIHILRDPATGAESWGWRRNDG